MSQLLSGENTSESFMQKSCVPYKCTYSIRGEDITLSWQKTQFLEFNENQIRLKRTHKYFDQILGQMAITGCTQTYFVVWTGKGLPLIEKGVFAQDHWDKIRSSVILFFKTFLQNFLLGFKSIYTCPVCSKYILEVDHHAGADD